VEIKALANPFDKEWTHSLSVGMAEDSRNPEPVFMAYTIDCLWQNRSGFIRGREEIISLLTRNRTRELDDRPVKELWAFEGSGMDVRFACQGQDDSGQWYRSCGNGNRESASSGRRDKRIAGIDDLPVRGSDFSDCHGRSSMEIRYRDDVRVGVDAALDLLRR